MSDPPIREDKRNVKVWDRWFQDMNRQVKNLSEFSDWIAAGVGITVTDDGDGTVTIKVKQQTAEVDLGVVPDFSTLWVIAKPELESYLGDIRGKINNIIAKLESAEILQS